MSLARAGVALDQSGFVQVPDQRRGQERVELAAEQVSLQDGRDTDQGGGVSAVQRAGCRVVGGHGMSIADPVRPRRPPRR